VFLLAEENLDMCNSMTGSRTIYLVITADGFMEVVIISQSERQQKFYFVAWQSLYFK